MVLMEDAATCAVPSLDEQLEWFDLQEPNSEAPPPVNVTILSRVKISAESSPVSQPPRLMRQKSRSLAAGSHKFLSMDEPQLHESLEKIWAQPDRESSLKQLLAEWRGQPQSAADALHLLVDQRTS